MSPGSRPTSIDVGAQRPASQDELQVREVRQKEAELQRKLRVSKEGRHRLEVRYGALGAEHNELKNNYRAHEAQINDVRKNHSTQEDTIRAREELQKEECRHSVAVIDELEKKVASVQQDPQAGSSGTGSHSKEREHMRKENAKVYQQTKEAQRSYKHLEVLLKSFKVRLDETTKKISEGKQIVMQRELQLTEWESASPPQSFSYIPSSRVNAGVDGEPSPEPPSSTPSNRLRVLKAKVTAAEEEVMELRNELRSLALDEKGMSSPSGKGALCESKSPNSGPLRDELRNQTEATDQVRLEVETLKRETAEIRAKLTQALERLGREKDLKRSGDASVEHKRLKAEKHALTKMKLRVETEMEMLMLQSIGSRKPKTGSRSDSDH